MAGMEPDFNKKTVDTLAKRSAFKCSNPDCRVGTVGPNSDPYKSVILGEAAHIFGARPKSKRFNSAMTDALRAEITNAIWLCRNCHKLIDSDEKYYSSEVLFGWRELHERYVQNELGTATDRLNFEIQEAKLLKYKNFPPVIRRIVIDQPPSWGWRLTAELMRFLNMPYLRKIADLRDGLYIRPQTFVAEDQLLGWVQQKLKEMGNLIPPIEKLLPRLSDNWGGGGEEPNEEEIFHVTSLVSDFLNQAVIHEEQIYFTNLPEGYEKLKSLLCDMVGSHAERFAEIPHDLDDLIARSMQSDSDSEEGREVVIIRKTFVLKAPDNWASEFQIEMQRIHGLEIKKNLLRKLMPQRYEKS